MESLVCYVQMAQRAWADMVQNLMHQVIHAFDRSIFNNSKQGLIILVQ